jgi:high-affinity iron transporter
LAFSFLVTLREGMEMALIVAILLGYLRNAGQRRHFREVWMGVAAAAGVCLAIGIGLELFSRELSKQAVEAFEGFAMIFAVVVLTGMALWMRRQASGLSRELKAAMDTAVGGGSVAAIVLLAASSVGREGLETTLFLFAGSSNAGSGAEFILGGLLGFAAAAAFGVLFYRGGTKLPMRQFFMVSGVLVVVLAAGLLANAPVKLYEAALINDLGPRPWDTESTLSMTSTPGKFVATLLGYDSAPSVTQITLYWGYLLAALTLFFALPRIPRIGRRANSLIKPERSQTSVRSDNLEG